MFASVPRIISSGSPDGAPEIRIPGISSHAIGEESCIRTLPVLRHPKIPLLSGSVLVLLTLFLPIAYSQCGSVRWTGGDYLLGFGTWPGSLGALSYAPGRVPYFLALVLAAVTLLFVLAAQVRPSLLHQPNLIPKLFVASGTLIFFAIGDFFGFELGSRIRDLVKPGSTPFRQNFLLLTLAVIAIAVATICLRSRFLRSLRWIVWLFAIAIAISAFAIVDSCLALFAASPAISWDWALVVTISSSFLYFVIPLGLWYQFGLSRRQELRTHWAGVQRRIILLYIPAVALDILVLASEMRPGGLWGLLPYYAGVTLLAWGYLGLQSETDPETKNAREPGSEFVTTLAVASTVQCSHHKAV